MSISEAHAEPAVTVSASLAASGKPCAASWTEASPNGSWLSCSSALGSSASAPRAAAARTSSIVRGASAASTSLRRWPWSFGLPAKEASGRRNTGAGYRKGAAECRPLATRLPCLLGDDGDGPLHPEWLVHQAHVLIRAGSIECLRPAVGECSERPDDPRAEVFR